MSDRKTKTERLRKHPWRYVWLLLFFLVFAVVGWLNWRFEVFAFHPFFGSDDHDLRVLTWNIHCNEKPSVERQRKIAELVIEQDADFVQLNEFEMENCLVLDSLLKLHYKYAEEEWADKTSGDIFYCKYPMAESGHILIPILGEMIQAMRATISVKGDSVYIIGCHLPSNSGDGSCIVSNVDSVARLSVFYDRYKEMQYERCQDAHVMKDSVLASRHPTIVMGDMNDFNCTPPMDSLTDVGLKNSWWEGGTGFGFTFHTGWMRLRIDHIFHDDKLELQRVRIVDTDLSDHNPMVADFKTRLRTKTITKNEFCVKD